MLIGTRFCSSSRCAAVTIISWMVVSDSPPRCSSCGGAGAGGNSGFATRIRTLRSFRNSNRSPVPSSSRVSATSCVRPAGAPFEVFPRAISDTKTSCSPVCRAYAASASASGCGGMSAASLAGDCARLAAAPSSATSAHEQRTLPTTDPHRRCRNAVLPTIGNPSVAIVGWDAALVLRIQAYTRAVTCRRQRVLHARRATSNA